MNTIVYVGMDVHKESYTLCCYSYDRDKVEFKQTIPSDYRLVLKYMERVREQYEGEVKFVCGYEAGCLGYSLYHQLTDHAVDYKHQSRQDGQKRCREHSKMPCIPYLQRGICT